MAKDKTKPRTELTSRREAALKLKRADNRKHRWRIARNILIALVIIGLATTGIVITVLHVQAGAKTLLMTGDPTVEQITPPNATSDGLAILANPSATFTDTTITVDMYVDYQDNNSIEAMQYFGQGLTDLSADGSIKLYYHLLYVSDTTNKNHSAGRAMVAAFCADTVGAFEGYNEALFANGNYYAGVGDGYTDLQLQTGFASTAGITGDDLTAFQTCYTTRATSTFATSMSSLNQTSPTPDKTNFPKGITATPVMMANGTTVSMSSVMDQYGTDNQLDSASLLTVLQSVVTPSDTTPS